MKIEVPIHDKSKQLTDIPKTYQHTFTYGTIAM